MSRTTLRHNNLCERRCFALVRTAFAKMIRLRTRTLRENLRRMPMLRTLLPFAAGIVLAERFALSSWALCVGLLGCGTAAALLLRRAVSEVYLAAALLLTGWLAAELHRTPATVPRTEPTEYALQPEEQPMRRGDRFVGTARLRAWRDPGAGEWRPSAGKIILYTDTAVRLQAGERLVCRTRLRGFSGAAPGYRNLMTRRGYVGSAWVSGRSLLARDTTPASGIGRLAARLHAGAVERIERLGLSPDTRALCLAMAAGEKRALTPELREAYARSGTSHLLAVSGLHVGIVFLVVNLLLQWLNLLPGGHRWRNIAAVALIWLYAATAGLSPSVVRAALMFTALQFALASGRSYLSVNILAGTAFVMLLTDPDQLFDLSFQLSFTAVAAIIAWGVPLGRSVRTRFRPLNALTGLLAAGLTAGAATAPLIAHTFGTVPLAGRSSCSRMRSCSRRSAGWRFPSASLRRRRVFCSKRQPGRRTLWSAGRRRCPAERWSGRRRKRRCGSPTSFSSRSRSCYGVPNGKKRYLCPDDRSRNIPSADRPGCHAGMFCPYWHPRTDESIPWSGLWNIRR